MDILGISFGDPMETLRMVLSKFSGGVGDVVTEATPAALQRGIPFTASVIML